MTKELTDWRERLEAEDITIHKDLANSWMVCAIGDSVLLDLGVRATREGNVSRCINSEAEQLGLDFGKEVSSGHREAAKKTLTAIENLETIWKD